MIFKKSGFVVNGVVQVIDKLPPGNAHPVRKVLRMMDTGQNFFVARVDWTAPSRTPMTMKKEVATEMMREFEFWVATDGSGWFIIRTA